MKLPKIKLKKVPYYLTLGLLTSGASMILGFLSFGGVLALSPLLPLALPILPLAVAAFALSVGYEGEIYLQNIKGAMNKLFKHNYMKRRLANEYLLTLFTDSNFDTKSADCPQFFKDYAFQCDLLRQFEHKTLEEESATHKKQVEKTLSDMEKWFARQLITENEKNTLVDEDYQKELQHWLKNPLKPALRQSEWESRFHTQKTKFHLFKVFSSLSALFMGLGTTYLLVDAFGAIPLMASISATTLPILIVPMAIIAGLAYGLLTYNAITDMLTNNKVLAMYHKIKTELNKGWTLHSVAMAATAGVLVVLAVLLTVCTAGTWWTVAKNTQPIFTWMGKLPSVVMGVINPIITGISALSALVFNMQNSAESLEIIAGYTETSLTGHAQSSPFQRLKDGLTRLNENENNWQIINPFRLILKITVTPLRVLLFLGHLISIGLTADRVPGVPEIVSALLGILSEGFEDLHYFVEHGQDGCCGHHHGDPLKSFIENRLSPAHSHNHDMDLPTKIIKLIFYPMYALAAGWDWLSSQIGSNPIIFEDAWDKQRGIPPKEQVVSVDLNRQAKPSVKWQVEHAVYRIERHKEKQLSGAVIGMDLVQKKIQALTRLQEKFLVSENTATWQCIENCIRSELPKPYNQHRFWGSGDSDKTKTSEFLNNLPVILKSGG